MKAKVRMEIETEVEVEVDIIEWNKAKIAGDEKAFLLQIYSLSDNYIVPSVNDINDFQDTTYFEYEDGSQMYFTCKWEGNYWQFKLQDEIVSKDIKFMKVGMHNAGDVRALRDYLNKTLEMYDEQESKLDFEDI